MDKVKLAFGQRFGREIVAKQLQVWAFHPLQKAHVDIGCHNPPAKLEATRMEAEDLLRNTPGCASIRRGILTARGAGAAVGLCDAKHVRVDGYCKRRRIQQHESAPESLPESPIAHEPLAAETPMFECLIASLPESQREVLTMLKVNGLSLEEVALAPPYTVGAVKQKASRAYAKLRILLSSSGSWRAASKETTGAR